MDAPELFCGFKVKSKGPTTYNKLVIFLAMKISLPLFVSSFQIPLHKKEECKIMTQRMNAWETSCAGFLKAVNSYAVSC